MIHDAGPILVEFHSTSGDGKGARDLVVFLAS